MKPRMATITDNGSHTAMTVCASMANSFRKLPGHDGAPQDIPPPSTPRGARIAASGRPALEPTREGAIRFEDREVVPRRRDAAVPFTARVSGAAGVAAPSGAKPRNRQGARGARRFFAGANFGLA